MRLTRLVTGLTAGLAAVVLLAGCVGSDGQPVAAPQQTDPAVVQTASGTLRGVVAPDHRLFADVPYAAPPVGPLRFADPQPPGPWQGVRDATAFGPRCMQSLDGDLELGRQTAEDCLSLNVWTPATDGAKRPVMVWLHGGGFVHGTGAEGWFQGDRLAQLGDVVVVTLNHRLGIFGFLGGENGDAAADSGIAGMLDIVMALQWVQANAAAFGGDPGNVTIFG